MDTVAVLAALLGVDEYRVRLELNRAVRRSEPDALEVYGLIGGRRFVARRLDTMTAWEVALEERPTRPRWTDLTGDQGTP